MKVKKILNNNVAIISKGTHESIAYSPGIAFKKKVGQQIEEKEISKLYVLDSKDRLEHLSFLLTHSDKKIITLVNKIVDYGENYLKVKVADYLYLALLDHISFALKRGQKGQFIASPLVWEVKKFYPQYYEIGIKAINWLNQTYEVNFPEDEAIPISLHFINVQDEQINVEQKVKDITVLRDLLNIIKYHFNINFDETSINYMRLVTHLQYFIDRLNCHELSTKTDVNVLYEQIRAIYPEAFRAVQKIDKYISKSFGQEISPDEYTYLMIHINRVTSRKDVGNEV